MAGVFGKHEIERNHPKLDQRFLREQILDVHHAQDRHHRVISLLNGEA